jgi:hypothetical protein
MLAGPVLLTFNTFCLLAAADERVIPRADGISYNGEHSLDFIYLLTCKS